MVFAIAQVNNFPFGVVLGQFGKFCLAAADKHTNTRA